MRDETCFILACVFGGTLGGSLIGYGLAESIHEREAREAQCEQCEELEYKLVREIESHKKPVEEPKPNRLECHEHLTSLNEESYWVKERRWIDRGESEYYDIMKAHHRWLFKLLNTDIGYDLGFGDKPPRIEVKGKISTLLSNKGEPICVFNTGSPMTLNKDAGWKPVYDETEIAEVIVQLKLEEAKRKAD